MKFRLMRKIFCECEQFLFYKYCVWEKLVYQKGVAKWGRCERNMNNYEHSLKKAFLERFFCIVR